MRKNKLNYLLHLLYPTKCPCCGTIINYNDDFCTKCMEQITAYHENFLPNESAGYIAAFNYDEKISPAVILLKDGICGNSAYALGTALAEKLKHTDFISNVELIIPVPMYKTDILRRGYNQAELIAREISDELRIPVCKKAVIKNIKTKAQKTLSQQERLTNLRGAFSVVNKNMIAGKSVLLIDDVCTTGSTLSEISKLLKKNGAKKVFCATCCKTTSSIINSNNEV